MNSAAIRPDPSPQQPSPSITQAVAPGPYLQSPMQTYHQPPYPAPVASLPPVPVQHAPIDQTHAQPPPHQPHHDEPPPVFQPGFVSQEYPVQQQLQQSHPPSQIAQLSQISPAQQPQFAPQPQLAPQPPQEQFGNIHVGAGFLPNLPGQDSQSFLNLPISKQRSVMDLTLDDERSNKLSGETHHDSNETKEEEDDDEETSDSEQDEDDTSQKRGSNGSDVPSVNSAPVSPSSASCDEFYKTPVLDLLALPPPLPKPKKPRRDEIKVSDLQFGELIGEGSFGKVYRGGLWGLDVAIKKLNRASLQTSIVKDFKKEVRVMRNLRHPNIVELLGVCVDPQNMCIVTEFLNKQSLEEQLEAKFKLGKKFSKQRSMKWAIEIANGLNWLHHKGIIHRDLKSANIMLDENYKAKIGDFGLSHVKKGNPNLGGFYGACGTPCYMAPEVLSKQSYNTKADVFSFGIVLCELVVGRYPYEGEPESTQTFEDAIVMGLRPEIPKESHPLMTNLIKACWAEKAAERPEMDEVLVTLRLIRNQMQLDTTVLHVIEDLPEEASKLFEEQQTRLENMEKTLLERTTKWRDAADKARLLTQDLDKANESLANKNQQLAVLKSRLLQLQAVAPRIFARTSQRQREARQKKVAKVSAIKEAAAVPVVGAVVAGTVKVKRKKTKTKQLGLKKRGQKPATTNRVASKRTRVAGEVGGDEPPLGKKPRRVGKAKLTKDKNSKLQISPGSKARGKAGSKGSKTPKGTKKSGAKVVESGPDMASEPAEKAEKNTEVGDVLETERGEGQALEPVTKEDKHALSPIAEGSHR